MKLNPLSPNEINIEAYFGYLIHVHNKTGPVVRRHAQAVFHHFRYNRVNWVRSERLRYSIRSLERRYPAISDQKKQFTHWFVWWVWFSFLNPKDVNFGYFACCMAMCIGYFLRCRPCEYSERANKPSYLRMSSLHYIPSKKHAKKIVLKLDKTKTNQQHKQIEILSIDCQCNESRFGKLLPCLVHYMIEYQRFRKRLWGKPSKSAPLLVNAEGESLKYWQVNNFLHKAILTLTHHSRIPLIPHQYTPHSLRVGGTTDLARSGANLLNIQKFGRWTTKEWQDTYVQLDFTDLARLTGQTTTSIRHSMRNSITQ